MALTWAADRSRESMPGIVSTINRPGSGRVLLSNAPTTVALWGRLSPAALPVQVDISDSGHQ